jgi:NodT family efflux transporter outer membrane factor (OMF) lipoprotein
MMRISVYARVAATGLCLAVAACALKPPPERSELVKQALGDVQPPPQWRAVGTEGPVTDGWLKTLNDAALIALVDETLARNVDLRVAATRVEQAEASLRIAGAGLLPAVSLLARGGGQLGGDGSGLTGAVITASWEIDVWGRVRYGERAAGGQLASLEADYGYARQSLAASVARGWFVAAESALQAQLAREMLVASQRLAELTGVRFKVGNATEQDVALAEANIQTYRDTLRQLLLSREQAVRSLELLAGRYPAAALAAAETLPPLPPPAPAGIPSELLERRPDVIAAERRVAAAFDRVEEARAARLPRIGLTAGIASIFSSLFVLQDRDNPTASIGAAFGVPLFTGGALEGQVDVRTAEQKRAIAEYAATGLKAFNEVESALATEAAMRDRAALLERLVAENERALKLSEIQFRVGVTDQRTVINDEMRLYGSRAQLLHLQAERLNQRVALYLALGGNFATETPR